MATYSFIDYIQENQDYLIYDKYIVLNNKEYNIYTNILNIKPEDILLLNNYNKYILHKLNYLRNNIEFKDYFITLKCPQMFYVGNNINTINKIINIFFE